MNLGRVLFLIALSAALVALAIRYPIHIQTQMSEGRGLLGAIGHLFSFFTIVMNTLVGLCLLAHTNLFRERMKPFRNPVVMGTAIAGILIVMIVYYLLLSETHNPTGISALTNVLQHYVVPIVFPLWWFFAGRIANMEWRHVPMMMIIPVIYLSWIFTRGAIIGEYPYDFLNVAEKGISGVAPILAAITFLFLIFGSFVVFFDKRTAAYCVCHPPQLRHCEDVGQPPQDHGFQ